MGTYLQNFTYSDQNQEYIFWGPFRVVNPKLKYYVIFKMVLMNDTN